MRQHRRAAAAAAAARRRPVLFRCGGRLWAAGLAGCGEGGPAALGLLGGPPAAPGLRACPVGLWACGRRRRRAALLPACPLPCCCCPAAALLPAPGLTACHTALRAWHRMGGGARALVRAGPGPAAHKGPRPSRRLGRGRSLAAATPPAVRPCTAAPGTLPSNCEACFTHAYRSNYSAPARKQRGGPLTSAAAGSKGSGGAAPGAEGASCPPLWPFGAAIDRCLRCLRCRRCLRRLRWDARRSGFSAHGSSVARCGKW